MSAMLSMTRSRDSPILVSSPEPILSGICTCLDTPVGSALPMPHVSRSKGLLSMPGGSKTKSCPYDPRHQRSKSTLKIPQGLQQGFLASTSFTHAWALSGECIGFSHALLWMRSIFHLDTRLRQVSEDYEYFCRIARCARIERAGRPEES